jgi:hypothetical protein
VAVPAREVPRAQLSDLTERRVDLGRAVRERANQHVVGVLVVVAALLKPGNSGDDGENSQDPDATLHYLVTTRRRTTA